MDIGETSLEFHSKGLNCAQSVLCACSKYSGLDYNTSFAVASGFGGGVRCGEICGAASGAVMAIGLFLAGKGVEDIKTEASSMTVAFIKRFKEKYGFVRCQDLKKNAVSCDELICFAAQTVEELFNNYI